MYAWLVPYLLVLALGVLLFLLIAVNLQERRRRAAATLPPPLKEEPLGDLPKPVPPVGHREQDRRRQEEDDQARRRASPETLGRIPVARLATRTPASQTLPAPTASLGMAAPVPSEPLALPSVPLSQTLGEPARVKERPLSPLAVEVRRLLHDPRGAAAAFLLREIFDRPLALRRK